MASGEGADGAVAEVAAQRREARGCGKDILGLQAPVGGGRSRQGACLRGGFRGTLVSHLCRLHAQVPLLPSSVVGSSAWGLLIPLAASPTTLDARLTGARRAAVDVPAVTARADAGEPAAALAVVEPVGVDEVVVGVDVPWPPGDNVIGPRRLSAGATRVRSCSSGPSPSWGQGCSAAGSLCGPSSDATRPAGGPVLGFTCREGLGGSRGLHRKGTGFDAYLQEEAGHRRKPSRGARNCRQTSQSYQ
jgi:hypothetical protein